MNDYQIWFENIFGGNVGEVQLPVNPQEVTITYPGNPTNYDVEGLGDIIIPRKVKLATLSFESFFPREGVFQTLLNNQYTNYTPDWFVNFFRRLQVSGRPFELTIVRGSDTLNIYDNDSNNPSKTGTMFFDTVMKAVLLDFSISDKGGEPGDIYYTMSLSEYRDASPKSLAEVAEETKDEDGNIIEQKLVMTVNRPQQDGVITSGRMIEINGKVFMSEDELIDMWDKTKQVANQVDRIVTRVLPPQVSNKLHSVYVDGMGWVNASDCQLTETKGTANSLNRLITNDY